MLQPKCAHLDTGDGWKATVRKEIGVRSKFEDLAAAFVPIPDLIRDLATAFTKKFEGLLANVNTAFETMSTNVTTAVE